MKIKCGTFLVRKKSYTKISQSTVILFVKSPIPHEAYDINHANKCPSVSQWKFLHVGGCSWPFIRLNNTQQCLCEIKQASKGICVSLWFSFHILQHFPSLPKEKKNYCLSWVISHIQVANELVLSPLPSPPSQFQWFSLLSVQLGESQVILMSDS